MLYKRAQAFIDHLVSRLDNQDYANFLSLHDFPVEFTLDGVPVSATRPGELEACVSKHSQALKEAGMVARQYTLMAVEVPSQSRFRVWVRSHYLDATGESFLTADKILHLRDKHGRLMVEEVHVHRRQLPEPVLWMPNAQRSA